MGKAIPTQHPAVVLRSHYMHLRALLAAAMIAVIGLTGAVVVLAIDDDRDTSTPTATHVTAPNPAGSTRYDSGPEEGTRGALPAPQPGVRYDGGPDEGTAALTQRSAPAALDPNSINSPPGVRYDGGPTRAPAARSPPARPRTPGPGPATTVAPRKAAGAAATSSHDRRQSRTGPRMGGPFAAQLGKGVHYSSAARPTRAAE